MAKKGSKGAGKAQSNLDLFKITSRTKSVESDLYEAYAFGKDPQDAFERVMMRINRTKEAGVTKGQQFDISRVEISDELVFSLKRTRDMSHEG